VLRDEKCAEKYFVRATQAKRRRAALIEAS
jgi:hypothetical protein